MLHKRIVISGLSLLAVIVALIGGFWWWLKQPSPPPADQLQSPSAFIGSPDPARCAEFSGESLRQQCQEQGPSAAVTTLMTEALERNDPGRCDAIPFSADRQRCVSDVAAQTSHPSTCERLPAADQLGCRYNVAVQTKDFAGCDQLGDATFADQCRRSIVALTAADEAFCDSLADEALRSTCQELAVITQAARTEDYKLCATLIAEAAQASCLAQLPPDRDNDGLSDYSEHTFLRTNPTKADTDGDGLNDYDELKVHGTDPTEVDTDADGYSDATEISKGYDPLK